MNAAIPVSTGVEARSLRLVGALASVIARPLDHLDPSAIDLPPIPGADLSRLGAHPAFRTPFNRALSRDLRLGEAPLDAAFVARLSSSPHVRLSALVATQPLARVREAALLLAAVILHRRVIGLVLRTDRDRVRVALGEAGFVVAVQEAPLLHPQLAELDIGAAGATALAPGLDPEVARTRLTGVGLRALSRFVAAQAPALRTLFEHRTPPAPGGKTSEGAFSEGICEHVVKLMRRRMDGWTAIIG